MSGVSMSNENARTAEAIIPAPNAALAWEKIARAQILARVVDCIVDLLGGDRDTGLETNFVDDFGADSIDIAELVVMLEDEWTGLNIPDEEQCFRDIGDVVDYIVAHLKKEGGNL